MPACPHRQLARRTFMADARGVVTVEYVVVVGTVGLVVVAALIGVGPKVVAAYDHSRDVLSQPYP